MQRCADDAGFTLVEVLVASVLLIIVGAIFSDAMISMQRVTVRAAGRSMANDEVRLAMYDLDRQIRSGNVLYDPTSEDEARIGVPDGYALRIYTQANAPSRSPGYRCVQWRVLGGALQTRQWSSEWEVDGVVTDWRTVARSIVNAGAGTPPFELVAAAPFNERLVNVSFLVAAEGNAGRPVRVSASLTGRNVQFAYPENVCADDPDPDRESP